MDKIVSNDEIDEALTFILFYSLIIFYFWFAYIFNKIIGPLWLQFNSDFKKHITITLFASFFSLLIWPSICI